MIIPAKPEELDFDTLPNGRPNVLPILTLCGVPRFSNARGNEVALPAKSLALLAFLTLERGRHSRDALSSLLWSDVPDIKARASLRQSLKTLRGVLDGRLLQVDRQSAAINPDFQCDVHDFLRALANEKHDAAVAFGIPRFITGWRVRGAVSFDHWVEQTREHLTLQYRRSLAAAARAAHTHQNWVRCLVLAEQWTQLDPLSDDAIHLLIDVQFRRGERDMALTSYRNFAARRAHETGTGPGLALRELATRIEHAPSKAKPHRVVMVGSVALPSLDAGVIERDGERLIMETAWHEIGSEGSRVVVVEGEAGTGKTRLVEEFLRHVTLEGATTLSTRGFSAGRDVPYGCLRDVLRGASQAAGAAGTDPVWLAEVARVVPEVRRDFPAIPSTATASTASIVQIPEAIAQLLLAVAEESPLVISLDDLQWFDADSCRLVNFLVHRLGAAPILWCVCCTLGETERAAPAARLVRALRAISGPLHMRLQPLSVEGVRQFVRVAGRQTHPDAGQRLSARLYEVTEGNPRALVELLTSLFNREWLTVDSNSGEWRSSDAQSEALLASDLFPSLREGIAERIAVLPDELQAVLPTVAITGNGCHASLLSYVHGISRLRAAHLCDRLIERHLVKEVGGRYECANGVIASVVIDAMTVSRRREVHRAVALALTDAAASVRQSADPGVIAKHAAEGGEYAMAHRFALQASERCQAQAAWDDAAAWLDLAGSCARTNLESAAADNATAILLTMRANP